MANGLYQTEGIILNSLDQGEADKVITVYTREFGMLRLFARGTRRSSSKLNKFLNIYSYGRFGFVSGKDSWHLIDAEDIRHFDSVLGNRERLESFGRVARFIERFHHGEMKDPEIFGLIENAIHYLRDIPGEILPEFELVFLSKALAIFGYLDEEAFDAKLLDLVSDNSFEDKIMILDDAEKAVLEGAVSEAIARSQL